MSEFLVNLMPAEGRALVRGRGRRRIGGLCAALALCSTVGLTAHSYVQWRSATSARDVALSLRQNAQNIDDVTASLATERDSLRSQLAVNSSIGMPVECSDVLATLTHLLPSGVWLEGVKITAIEPRPAAKKLNEPQTNVPAQPPYYEVRVVAVSRSEADAAVLAESISGTPPFTGVARQEQRSRSGASGTEHVFTLSFHADPAAGSRSGGRQVARSSR